MVADPLVAVVSVSVPYPFVERRTRWTATPDDGAQKVPRQRGPADLPRLPRARDGHQALRGRPPGWLPSADAVALLAVQGGAVLFLGPYGATEGSVEVVGLLVASLLFCTAVAVSGGYRRRQLDGGPDQWRLIGLAALGASVLAVSLLEAPPDVPGGLAVAVLVPAAVVTVLAVLVRAAWRAAAGGTTLVLAVGDTRTVEDLVSSTAHSTGLTVIGACVPGGRSASLVALGVPVLGDLDAVAAVVRRFAVDAVAVTACADVPAPSLRRLSWDLEGTGVQLVVAAGLLDAAGGRLSLRELAGVPFLALAEPALKDPRRILKSGVDRSVALLALVLLSPVLVGIAVAVRATSPGGSLFGQTRVGRHGREFRIWKFRSMRHGAEDGLAELLGDSDHGDGLLFKILRDQRITPLGRWLRRWSLDELPQLVNVLRGQMSLVGPRPPLPSEVGRYDADVRRRLLVTPGMTGSWQVNGRSELSWDDSIQLDLRYVEDWSLGLDLRLVCQTFSAVLRGRGAY